MGTLDNKINRPFGIKVYFVEGAEDDCCVIDYSTGKIDTFYTTDFNGNNYNTEKSFGHPNNLAHEKIIAPKFFEELKKWIIT